MPSATIVVPCFDESARLQPERFLAFRNQQPSVRFVMVNDGSGDDTLARLQALAASDPEGFTCLDLQPNRGKAEAVRAGVLHGMQDDSDYVGYWDADLSTPLDELPRFLEVLESRADIEIVFGARVQLLGRSIRRSATRHYLGRVFATVVSNLLRLAIYDTQCGAKLFRKSETTRKLFAEPFLTRWIFDVEMVARLIQLQKLTQGPPVADSIYELPLMSWHDVPGSKVRPLDFVRAIVETLRIYARYLR